MTAKGTLFASGDLLISWIETSLIATGKTVEAGALKSLPSDYLSILYPEIAMFGPAGHQVSADLSWIEERIKTYVSSSKDVSSDLSKHWTAQGTYMAVTKQFDGHFTLRLAQLSSADQASAIVKRHSSLVAIILAARSYITGTFFSYNITEEEKRDLQLPFLKMMESDDE